MSARPDADVALANVEVVSGVSAFDNAPFCLIAAQLTDGRVFTGQLEPAAVRTMALGFLEAAESSEHDAIVIRMMRERLGVDEDTAAAFIFELRQLRAPG